MVKAKLSVKCNSFFWRQLRDVKAYMIAVMDISNMCQYYRLNDLIVYLC